jgi:hypothetical protein
MRKQVMKTANLENPQMELLKTRVIKDWILKKQKIAVRTAEIPKKYRKIYKKAVETLSKTAAIKAFCLECVCWQKNEIINCSCLACPLFGVRPYLNLRQPAKNDGFSGKTQAHLDQPIQNNPQHQFDSCLIPKP